MRRLIVMSLATCLFAVTLIGCSTTDDADAACERQRLAVWDVVNEDLDAYMVLDFEGCVARAHELDASLPDDWGICPSGGELSFDFSSEDGESGGLVCSIHGEIPFPE